MAEKKTSMLRSLLDFARDRKFMGERTISFSEGIRVGVGIGAVVIALAGFASRQFEDPAPSFAQPGRERILLVDVPLALNGSKLGPGAHPVPVFRVAVPASDPGAALACTNEKLAAANIPGSRGVVADLDRKGSFAQPAPIMVKTVETRSPLRYAFPATASPVDFEGSLVREEAVTVAMREDRQSSLRRELGSAEATFPRVERKELNRLQAMEPDAQRGAIEIKGNDFGRAAVQWAEKLPLESSIKWEMGKVDRDVVRRRFSVAADIALNCGDRSVNERNAPHFFWKKKPTRPWV